MKILLLLFFFFSLQFATAQHSTETIVPDERLYEVYEKAYLDALAKENPFLIKRWNFYLDHAFLVADEIAGKTEAYPTVIIPDVNNINILLLEKEQRLHKDWDKPVIYKIQNTGKILVYHAGKDFTESLNKYLAEN